MSISNVRHWRFAPPTSSIETAVRSGDTATEILGVAQTRAADTIVMATHSSRGVDRLMLGSVAERVVHGANVPVLLLCVG